jgi:hypothetical protein
VSAVAEDLTHCALVERGYRWLRSQGCNIVLREFVCQTSEQPDVIGWKAGMTIMIECKASRSDFLADKNKPFRREPEHGMGDFRLYLAPPGIIALSDLPEGWGLLIAHRNKIEIAGPHPRVYRSDYGMSKGRKMVSWHPTPFTGNRQNEAFMLLSVLRRMQIHHGDGEFDRLCHRTFREKEAELNAAAHSDTGEGRSP